MKNYLAQIYMTMQQNTENGDTFKFILYILRTTDLYICIFVEETNKRLHDMKEKINTAQQTFIATNFRTNTSNLELSIEKEKE